MKSDLYVDNLASGTDNEEEATTFFNQSRTIMTPVQFNLRSWNSNSSKVNALATERNIRDTDPETKVLGLRWNTKDDVLKLQPQGQNNDRKNLRKTTKRDVLRESAKVYDPLGLLSPITIRAKIFIQELWERGFEWDEPLPDDIQKQWLDIAQDLADSTHIEVQRRYFPLLPSWPSDAVLHVFVDASIKAYGTVAYLTSGAHTTMVMSKSRVAPLKKLTLPQLELMAAVVGARLASYLRNQTLVPEDPQTDHDDSPSNETPHSTLASHAGIGNVINLSNFSDLQRLLKTTAWILRFVNILRKSQASKSSTLNVSEVIHAKNVWIREIQSQVYHNELANLQHKTASRLLLVRQLCLFLLDDNIISPTSSEQPFHYIGGQRCTRAIATLGIKPHPNPRSPTLLDSPGSPVHQEVATPLCNMSQGEW